MPKIGAKTLMVAPFAASQTAESAPAYGTGFILSELVKCDETLNYAEGEFYADNTRTDYDRKIDGGSVKTDLRQASLENLGTIIGATYDETDKTLEISQADVPPFCGVGIITEYSLGGTRSWRTTLYHKARAKYSGNSSQTGNKSITFTGDSLDWELFTDDLGKVLTYTEYTTEAAALAGLKTALNYPTT